MCALAGSKRALLRISSDILAVSLKFLFPLVISFPFPDYFSEVNMKFILINPSKIYINGN